MDNMGMVAYTDNNFAYVKFDRISSCGDNCVSCSGACNVKQHLVKVQNKLGAEKGDLVEVSINGRDFLKMSFLLYGLPLIILATSIIILEKLLSNTLIASIVGMSLCVASFFAINHIVKKNDKNGNVAVKMDRVVKNLENVQAKSE